MIRASTVSPRPPTVVVREFPPFSSFAPVTLEEIHRLVLVAPCKTCELDQVPTWLVKRSVDLLAPVIVDICSASLQKGYFPASQKQARVSARLKKPSMDPDDLSSFRPISNLSFLSKIVERVAVRQRHANENDLLPERQSAYRRFHSTESALPAVYNDIVLAINAGHAVTLTLLCLSSAFDTVDHAILLSTLQYKLSVSGHALEWFRSYLSDRTQVFVAQSCETLPVPLTSGVPQGSSLGPAQFISYTECSVLRQLPSHHHMHSIHVDPSFILHQ